MPDEQELQDTAVTHRRGRRQPAKEAQEALGAPIGAAGSPVEGSAAQAATEPAAPAPRRRGPRAKPANISGGEVIDVSGAETMGTSSTHVVGCAGRSRCDANRGCSRRDAHDCPPPSDQERHSWRDGRWRDASGRGRAERAEFGRGIPGAAPQGEAQRFEASVPAEMANADPSETPPAKGRRGGRGRSAEQRAEQAAQTQPALLAEAAPAISAPSTDSTGAQETTTNEPQEQAAHPQTGRPLRRRYSHAAPADFGAGMNPAAPSGESTPPVTQGASSASPAAEAPGYAGEQPPSASTATTMSAPANVPRTRPRTRLNAMAGADSISSSN